MSYNDDPIALQIRLNAIREKAEFNTADETELDKTIHNIFVDEDLSYEEYFEAMKRVSESQAVKLRESMIDHLMKNDIDLEDELTLVPLDTEDKI